MKDQVLKDIDKLLSQNTKEEMLQVLNEYIPKVDWSDKFNFCAQERFHHVMSMVSLIKELPIEQAKEGIKSYCESERTYYDIIKSYKKEA